MPRQYALILVSSLFLEENDLHVGNIALDDKNNLIKYDHDQSFSTLSMEKTLIFNANDFLSLPLIGENIKGNYLQFNFMDNELLHLNYCVIPRLINSLTQPVYN